MLAVSAGERHSLALKADGTVWAWGSNAHGALGDGTTVDRPVAARVPGLDRVFAIAAGGERSFAVRADGTVWGWGENSTGALGIGTLTDALVPTQVGVGVPGFGNVIRMAAGQRHTLALRIDGQVFQFGALIPTSPATTGPQVRPSLVEALAGVTLVTAGERLSVALDINGGLWSWGPNSRGQLGLGASGTRAVPTRITQSDDGSPMPPVLRVAAGPDFVTARAFDGTLLSWGAGTEGQLGNSALLDRPLPTRAGPLSGPLQSIAAGGVHAFAALADGTLDAWGANDAGQLGGATAASRLPSPSPVPNLDLD
ncbi:MAG: hypothetical protein MUC32_03470 [Burkholderiaceae bacterium]|nr:hypothetical protein [Burkholderiaceae bacterium]